MLSLLSLLLSFLPLLAHAASAKGGVSLWSDSQCGGTDTTNFGERNPVELNYTLNIDTCGTPGATVHSYKVLQRPTCANGTTAAFAFYHGEGCKSEGFGPALNSFSTYDAYDNVCLALVEFNSVAFICAGLGEIDGNANPSPTSTSPSSVAVSSSSVVVTSTIASSAFATPLVPSATIASPLYPIPAKSSSFPTSTIGSVGIASATPSAPSSSIHASPFVFTGVAPSFRISVTKLVVLFGGLLLL